MRTLTRGSLAVLVAVLAVALSSCADPAPAPATPEPVDYLGAYAAYDEAFRTLELADPTPQDADKASVYLGWSAQSPYELHTYDPAGDGSLTMCTSETATNMFISSITGPGGEGTLVLLSKNGCVESLEDAEAVVSFPARGEPDIPKGADDIDTVVSYLAGHRERARESRAVATTVRKIGARLTSRHDRTGAFPGVSAAELAEDLDVKVPAGVQVSDYTPTGAEANVCVSGTDVGAWAMYQASQRAVIRAGVTGGDCGM